MIRICRYTLLTMFGLVGCFDSSKDHEGGTDTDNGYRHGERSDRYKERHRDGY